jgi:cytochrome b561
MHGSFRAPGYDWVAKSLHWLVVILLASQFAIAWTMPPIHRGTVPQGLIDLHLSVGVLVIALVIVRVLWRLGHPVPLAQDGGPPWQHRAAEATHLALYALLLLVPILGWANASARGWTVGLFGLVPLPAILPQGAAYGPFIGDIHTFASYTLLGVVGLHVLAVLYHRLILGDDTLQRMRPGRG